MTLLRLYDYFIECGMVTTDSRHCPEGSMFFALKGSNFNGNAFAEAALEKGCRYAVVDEEQYVNGNPRIFLVKNVLETLQKLAKLHRHEIGIPIIGITGTNGKTTTKELIAAVLRKKYQILATEGNLNNHIGVPLTLLKLNEDLDMAVVEMGASHPGDIKELVDIADPDYGIITNVGMAHLEGFGSFEGVLNTKCELYDYLRVHGWHTVFMDAENEHLKTRSQDLTVISYGTEGDDLYVKGTLGPCDPFLTFKWSFEGKEHEVKTHLIGSYNLKNALAAITIGCFFHVPAPAICEALEEYVPHNNRSQLTETEHNHLVVDAYNANPTSMHAALENFRIMNVPHKMVILGDMRELGASSVEAHQKVLEYLSTCGFDRVILVGEEFGKVNTGYEHYPDVEALKVVLAQHLPENMYILIKGSNSMKLAQLQEIL